MQLGKKEICDMLVCILFFEDVIDFVLRKYDILGWIKYLLFVESCLQNKVVLLVGVVGLWQIMFVIGKGFGLCIN